MTPTFNASKCCKQPVVTSFGEEGTNCWTCIRCKNPCDAISSYTGGICYAKKTNPMAYAFIGIMVGLLVGVMFWK
jgi:hypothetical protein